MRGNTRKKGEEGREGSEEWVKPVIELSRTQSEGKEKRRPT